jgi:hypothetical protein
MARTLETLEPGTPIYAGAQRVGVVRALYAEGDSRAVDVVVAHWDARSEDVVIPAFEIENVSDDRVELLRQEADQYADLAPFDAAHFPTMKLLA